MYCTLDIKKELLLFINKIERANKTMCSGEGIDIYNYMSDFYGDCNDDWYNYKPMDIEDDIKKIRELISKL